MRTPSRMSIHSKQAWVTDLHKLAQEIERLKNVADDTFGANSNVTTCLEQAETEVDAAIDEFQIDEEVD